MAYATIVVATLVALSGLLPDMSEEGGTDFLMEPVVSGTSRLVLGAAALVVLGSAMLVALSPAGRRLRCPHDMKVLVPLLVAAAYIALTYRVASAAVGGANIGGGLLLLIGIPLVPGLLIIAAAYGWGGVRDGRHPD